MKIIQVPMFQPQNILSIGLKSEFLLFDHISEIHPREEYLVIKTPRNPKYVSANFVLFKNGPDKTALHSWPLIFEKEFLNDNTIKHIKLVWDGLTDQKDNILSFLENGFELENYRTLTTDELLIKPNLHPKLEIKIIATNKEWESVVQDQMLFKPEGLTEKYYKEFSIQLMKDYKSIIELGKSIWFGAFIGSEMVGSTGLLWSDELVAFQRVVVKESYQNQGICKTMLYYITQWISKELKNRTLVILAETDSFAEHIYQSLGFNVKEELIAVYRYPE